MKRLPVVLTMLILSFAITHAQVPDVTLQDIQTVPPESLAVAADTSPLVGDTVRTTGVIYFPPGLSSSVPAGDAKIFIMDVAGGNEFSGLNVITLGGTGDLLAGFQVGDSVSVTGSVSEFSTQTQISPTEGLVLLGISPAPEPVVIDLADLGGTTQDTVDFATAERWESVLVKIENVTVVNDNFDAFSSWVVEDANGNQVLISSDSDSLRTVNDSRGTGNVDPSAAFVIPPIGSNLEFIVGHVDTRFGTNSINPRFPSLDIKFGAGVPPSVGNHDRSPVGPTSADAVVVTVDVTDEDDAVSGATLSYQVDGGSVNEVTMTATTGDEFSATIPAQANGALVTYYVTATDNSGNETSAPTGAPDTNGFLYYVRDEGILIRDLQMSPFGGQTGYFGLTVTVSGIAVSDSADYSDRFMLQQGSGAYNGITVFTGSGNVTVGRGDSLSVTGRATEFRDLTEIDRLDTVIVISTGNALPAPTDVSTGDVNTGGAMAESLESVLVRVSDVTIVNGDLGFGEWSIDDGSGELRVDDRGQFTYTTTDTASADFIPEGTMIGSLTAPLDFAFGDFRLIPRDNDDFEGVVTDVENPLAVPETFSLSQNYPNPFNPETTIQYQLAASGEVELRIYNIIGQLVRNLSQKTQPAGTHRIVWDGKNDRGLLVPSGVYIYQLRAEGFEQSKKMILLK